MPLDAETVGAASVAAETDRLMEPLSRDAQFLSMLCQGVNKDGDVEPLLERLRRTLLFSDRGGTGFYSKKLVPLVAALAQQCFNNEYIFHEDEEESRTVRETEERLLRAFDEGASLAFEGSLLALGMYRPLAHLPLAVRIAEVPIERFSEEARPAIRRMILEPLEEDRLSRLLPSFGEVSCATSKRVRAQYEENPYPRWFDLTPKSLESTLARLKPGFAWPRFSRAPRLSPGESPAAASSESLEILVPGCGTGRHPLSLAAGSPNAHVLAVDLSRSSLAYGKRMSEKLRIENVTFLQGDLLEIPKLGKRFHHIDCVGVLHHMRDPSAGWQALHEVLLPGGSLRIGVYSRVARMHVAFLRAEIEREGIPPTREAMKAFRHRLSTDANYRTLLPSLRACADFFSLSTFRDYLFHASEYCYTISEIRELVQRFGFEFLGFNTPLKTRYRELFPGDSEMTSLANWQEFEANYAGSNAMLTFWLQKPRSEICN